MEEIMHFRIRGLPAEHFAPLFTLSDEALAGQGAVRRIADGARPCRVSLTDATPGDELILVNYEHHAVHSPYRMRFAIYVRQGEETFDEVDTVPERLRGCFPIHAQPTCTRTLPPLAAMRHGSSGLDASHPSHPAVTRLTTTHFIACHGDALSY